MTGAGQENHGPVDDSNSLLYVRQEYEEESSSSEEESSSDEESDCDDDSNDSHDSEEEDESRHPNRTPPSYTYPDDGSAYYGPLDDNGKPHGTGTLYKTNPTSKYVGEFQHGHVSGEGVLEEDGITYKGVFTGKEFHKMEGQYDVTYANGSTYSGDFHNGLRHGRGTWNLANKGGTYVGQFQRDRPHGRGTYTEPMLLHKGRTLHGFFQNGICHGYARFTDANGKILYDGNWEDGYEAPQNNVWTLKLDEDCPICHDRFSMDQDLVSTVCKHLFHKHCLDEWMKVGKDTCPKCQKDGLLFSGNLMDKDASKTLVGNDEQTPLHPPRDDNNGSS